MELILTAVAANFAPMTDIVFNFVVGNGLGILEVQTYDHSFDDKFSALYLRAAWSGDESQFARIRSELNRIAEAKKFKLRLWSPDLRRSRPRLALCVTHRHEHPLAVLRAIRDRRLDADVAVMIGNQPTCRYVAEQFNVDWKMIGDAHGVPNNDLFERILERYDVDYVILARYMRIVPPAMVRTFSGGRIINLHHGLLPGFPGAKPYHEAYTHKMLSFGATCHYIVPELGAGEQTIHQQAFSVPPGTSLKEIIRIGQTDNEPATLVEGIRRVVAGNARLKFHKVVGSQEALADVVDGEKTDVAS